jgi:hypothetical protein
MAYLGKEPSVGSFQKLDSIRGLQNGVRTAFPLTISDISYTPDSVNQLMVVKNGDVLEPGEGFSVNGTNITITPVLEANDIVWILTYGQARFTGVPSAGTVTSDTIADASIEYDKLSGDTVATIIGNIITFGI